MHVNWRLHPTCIKLLDLSIDCWILLVCLSAHLFVCVCVPGLPISPLMQCLLPLQADADSNQGVGSRLVLPGFRQAHSSPPPPHSGCHCCACTCCACPALQEEVRTDGHRCTPLEADCVQSAVQVLYRKPWPSGLSTWCCASTCSACLASQMRVCNVGHPSVYAFVRHHHLFVCRV